MASVIAHLSVLALLVLVSEVSPLEHAAESIAINIVSSAEVEPEQPRPTEQQQPSPSDPPVPPQPSLAAEAAVPIAPPAGPKQQSAALRVPQAAPVQPKAQAGSASPSYRQPEPDLSVKYNVLLGLPPELPPLAAPMAKSDAGFDESTIAADVAPGVLTEFRRHLKSCSKLPASVQRTDHIVVKLRVFLTQDGRLAAEPAIGGGSANVKAIELLQGAIAALKQCQPYGMLPADRYGEWMVLDLDFTPKDFSG